MKKSIFFFLTLALVITSLNSCKDKDDDMTIDEPTEFNLSFDIAHTYNGDPLTLSSTEQLYTDGAGNELSFTDLKYLLTNIVLQKSDGTDYIPKNAEAFIHLAEDRTSFTLEDVPVGEYTGIRFFVGVDEVKNHEDPNQYTVDHPLSPILNDMHWNWNGGYIFLTLEGLYKNDAAEIDGFVYHIATDNFLMEYDFKNINFNLDANKTVKLSFHADEVFSNPNVIDIPLMGATTHSGNDGGIAEKIHINMESAISLDAVQ